MRRIAMRLAPAAMAALLLAGAAPGPTMSLVLMGRDADKVGNAAAGPDGRYDLHLRLTMPSDADIAAVDVVLDIGATNWSWSTRGRDRDAFFLALENTAPGMFDLYGTDNGVLGVGRSPDVTVTLKNGTVRKQKISLKTPPGRVLAHWRAVCFGNGQGFEPQSLSGGLFFDIARDGAVNGSFDGGVLRGSRQGRKLTGTAERGGKSYPFTGEVTTARDGTVTGKGEIGDGAVESNCTGISWESE